MLKEYEYINVPTMKTHLQTKVSLGFKNLKAYDGSMKDWEKKGLPLKTGDQP